MEIVVKLADSCRQQAIDNYEKIIKDAESYKRSDETTYESVVQTASLEIPDSKFKGITGTVTIDAPLFKVAGTFLKMRENITPETSETIASGTLFSKFYFFTADDEAEYKKLRAGEQCTSFPLYTHNAAKSPSALVKHRDFVNLGYVKISDDSITAAFRSTDYD